MIHNDYLHHAIALKRSSTPVIFTGAITMNSNRHELINSAQWRPYPCVDERIAGKSYSISRVPFYTNYPQFKITGNCIQLANGTYVPCYADGGSHRLLLV